MMSMLHASRLPSARHPSPFFFSSLPLPAFGARQLAILVSFSFNSPPLLEYTIIQIPLSSSDEFSSLIDHPASVHTLRNRVFSHILTPGFSSRHHAPVSAHPRQVLFIEQCD